jgi:hypothetical protein
LQLLNTENRIKNENGGNRNQGNQKSLILLTMKA